MRICSRCNASVSKRDTNCPRCGFSLIKNEYGQRIDSLNDVKMKRVTTGVLGIDTDKPKSNKVSSVFIVIFILVFMSSFVPIILTSLYFNRVDISSEVMEADTELLKSYTADVVRIASDYNKAWSLYKEDNTITLEAIVTNLTLNISDMTNDSCIAYTKDKKEKDLLSCVYKAYEDADIYTKVNNDVTKLYSYVYDFEDGDVRTVLVDVYGYVYDLYYLPESKDTYEEYKKEYDKNINALNNAFDNLLNDKEI